MNPELRDLLAVGLTCDDDTLRQSEVLDQILDARRERLGSSARAAYQLRPLKIRSAAIAAFIDAQLRGNVEVDFWLHQPDDPKYHHYQDEE